MIILNKDKRRETLLAPFYINPNEASSCKRFTNLDVETFRTLMDEGFIKPNSSQNYSPEAQEFLDFMEEYPFIKAHGYAISKDRPDYRITIEGLEGSFKDAKEDALFIIEFTNLCRGADEFDIDYPSRSIYAWWD